MNDESVTRCVYGDSAVMKVTEVLTLTRYSSTHLRTLLTPHSEMTMQRLCYDQTSPGQDTWPLIGRESLRDLDTGLRFEIINNVTWVLASDWSRLIM